jgi:hypothetical protein
VSKLILVMELVCHCNWLGFRCLLNEECRSHSGRLVGARDWMEVRESIMDYKQRSLGLQKKLN